MSIDVDYHRRLELLAELMIQNPHRRMKKLQREALKYYPLYYKENIRHWMGFRTAFRASDLIDEYGWEFPPAPNRRNV